nr:major capsid protein [Brevibacterium sp. 68QC2CO]
MAQADIAALVVNPTRIQSRLESLNEGKYIIDYLFGASPADGGAIVFDRNISNPYLERDAQAIDAGAEFPKLTDTDIEPGLARVQKYGGEVDMSLEAIRRNDQAYYTNKVTRLANTVVRKTNTIAVATLLADPLIPSYASGTAWTDGAADPLADLMRAQSLVDDNDNGYQSNVALINPEDALLLKTRKDVRDALPRETKELSPVLSRDLSGLLELEWIKSPMVTKGTAWIADRNSLGVVGDEEGGLKADSYEEKHRQVQVLQAWRACVPVVTDPFSAVKITGIS